MPDFDFNCPHCQHSLEASPDISGATVNCPACGKPFLVPAPPVPETSVSAPSTPSVCPSCNSPMPDKSVLCVNCGFDLRTNQPVSAELPPFLPPESAPEGRQLAVGNRNQSALVPKNRGTKQEKKWVKTQFDEFEDITTTDYTQEIFYPVYKAFKLAEESVQFIINLRHVNSKDGESIFIFCNFKKKDAWFGAVNGVFTLNCDQENKKLAYNQIKTDVSTTTSSMGFSNGDIAVGSASSTSMCMEYGYYTIDKLILKEICDSHELKIRISGADDYVTPEQEWCKKFHDHCCLFYNNLYDQNAYLNNIEKFNIKEVNKKFIWIGVSIGIIVPFFITLIAEIKNQDLGLIMFFEFFVISPVGAFLGFLIAKLICKKMYG